METNTDTTNNSNDLESKGLLRDLWRGKVPLVIAYWGFGVVGTLSIYGIASVIIEAYTNKFLALYLLAMMVFYQLFVSVSVWRSSKKYRGKNLYAILAQAAVFIGWFSSIPKVILQALIILNS